LGINLKQRRRQNVELKARELCTQTTLRLVWVAVVILSFDLKAHFVHQGHFDHKADPVPGVTPNPKY
jgi:hypothetical protein